MHTVRVFIGFTAGLAFLGGGDVSLAQESAQSANGETVLPPAASRVTTQPWNALLAAPSSRFAHPGMSSRL
jgi:hypothetical protein